MDERFFIINCKSNIFGLNFYKIQENFFYTRTFQRCKKFRKYNYNFEVHSEVNFQILIFRSFRIRRNFECKKFSNQQSFVVNYSSNILFFGLNFYMSFRFKNIFMQEIS